MIKEHFQHITLPGNSEYPTMPSRDVNDFLHAYAPYNDTLVISLEDAFYLVLHGVPFYFKGAVRPSKAPTRTSGSLPPL
ncbi:unnamed protein product [Closterium sp. NIES-64]|nr:unnamed protein product [Closterium sp. NIES-64]